ncbi:hypothetical protein [Paenibacillus ginsengihumi]|uniref:hypothetical protein n=1 Tax=Paenibacillus ginsengihumi TaxID=431596 RepID=UPI0003720044|nr:hypothetical protein [Paenibacillus ginsengihumi]
MSSYEAIKDCVNLGFEEYVTHQHYNTAQAAAKIVEEDWWILNEDNFSKTAFFICHKERMEMDNYQIIETNPVWKGRLESILSLKREDL